ncbi:molecular chaperone [Serratia fonticola]|jgi:fimbrial chaperone protein|uniref:fimbrial biogenesis chaperone n=1 Tax=Serratia fonticola TaxID=47917 RepID=UPI0015C682B6|nr:molecular chaperone [Serratia fonticola]NXZ90140.1 molecular chaperone [Serratia fonticola]NYA46062.1 molecular chaperone [Serratia fonticola]
MFYTKKLPILRVSVFLAAAFISHAFASGVGINATRVVFIEGSQSAPVIIRNNNPDESYLVQSYLADNKKQNNSIPFDVLPPIFRLLPDNRNEVRIVEKINSLPKDRESVFYFHARAIPANTKKNGLDVKENNGVIKIALESVIKVFYRPKNLPSSPQQAQGNLRFEPVSGGLKVSNTSPYYISLAKLTVDKLSITLSIEKNNAMIAPFSELFYATPVNKGNVSWTTINDLGGYDVHNQKI